MKIVVVFLLGVALGAGGYWYFTNEQGQNDLQKVKDGVAEEAHKVKESIKNTVGEIKAEDIKEELARTGTVIREKAKEAGQVIKDATADARISTAIKTKLATEPGVSALKINVDTSDGLVTLSGKAKTEDEVAKAVRIALDTEGVRKVVSTIQVPSEK